MNKKISTEFALTVILILAIFFGITFWVIGKKIDIQESYPFLTISEKKTVSQPEKCQIKAYASKGKKIKLWMDENKDINIANEYLKVLPNYSDTEEFKNENTIVKIVDTSSQLEKNLVASSLTKPIEVSISGYAKTCKGFALASINYKDGIFNDYLKK